MANLKPLLLLLCLAMAVAVAGSSSGCIPPPTTPRPLPLSTAPVPDELGEMVDWRARGAVTPVKNQGSFGSCWAFSAIGAVEGLHKIKTGLLANLSSQQVCDCAPKAGSRTRFKAFYWIRHNSGVATEDAYPYTGRGDQACRAAATSASIAGYERINTDAELLVAVARQPVAVRMKLHRPSFRYPSGRIFNGPCGNDVHAMLVVGYAETDDGIKYWIVKNSYGDQWAYGGYFFVKRGAGSGGGVCDIAQKAAHPI